MRSPGSLDRFSSGRLGKNVQKESSWPKAGRVRRSCAGDRAGSSVDYKRPPAHGCGRADRLETKPAPAPVWQVGVHGVTLFRKTTTETEDPMFPSDTALEVDDAAGWEQRSKSQSPPVGTCWRRARSLGGSTCVVGRSLESPWFDHSAVLVGIRLEEAFQPSGVSSRGDDDSVLSA